MSNPAFKFDHVHIISKDPQASANWYVEMFGATIVANTMARGAPRFLSISAGGKACCRWFWIPASAGMTMR